MVVAILAELLEARMQVADVRDTAHNRLAVELDDEPQHAVGGGMLRAHVHEQVLAPEIGFARVRIGPRRQRDSCRPPLTIDAGRPGPGLARPFGYGAPGRR